MDIGQDAGKFKQGAGANSIAISINLVSSSSKK
jgi:hypothetical protein